MKEKNKKAGFTIIELIVVIAIISLLSSVVIANTQNVFKGAKISRAKADLKSLATAIALLESDTGQSPAHLTQSPCMQDPETYMNQCSAGIQCNDTFVNWKGPYSSSDLKDPWGTYYYFDGDYQCIDQIGCEGIASGSWVRVVVSFGPNKSENYGSPGSDDIVKVLCK